MMIDRGVNGHVEESNVRRRPVFPAIVRAPGGGRSTGRRPLTELGAEPPFVGEARATANSGTIGLPIDDFAPEALSPVPATSVSSYAPGSGAPDRSESAEDNPRD
jgi:hypothetical protein